MLPGWVATFYVRYGCNREGPYYVRRWKKNGILHKEYVKPADLERVQAACQRHRERRQRQVQCGKDLTTVCGNLNFLLRMVRRSRKGTLRAEEYCHLEILETQGPKAPGRPKLRTPRSFMVPFFANHPSNPQNPPPKCQKKANPLPQGRIGEPNPQFPLRTQYASLNARCTKHNNQHFRA